jgi:serine/threonine protein kinase
VEKLKIWLDREGKPRSYYELLGIAWFATDRDAVLREVLAATKYFHQHQNHKDRQVVQRARSLQLLCAGASHTFSDDARWRDYDLELMDRLRDEFLAMTPRPDIRTWLLASVPVAENRIDEVIRILSSSPTRFASSKNLTTSQHGPSGVAASAPSAIPPGATERQSQQASPTNDASGPGTGSASSRMPPFRFGNYRVLERLGEGGIGVVFKARHLQLERLVALKLLRCDKSVDAGAIARFHQEMRAIGKLDHPNIVRATDAGEHDGSQFLAMELIDGLNLQQIVQSRGPLPVVEVCDIIRQAALGLQHAHEQGLVHRDIKPSNLMWSRDGTVKILDLGLALLAPEMLNLEAGDDDPGAELTALGMIVGTVDYMAPEQLNGRHHVDTRSDVYSLGCTMFHLLTGRAVFRDCGSDMFQRMAAHVNQPIPPLSRFREDVPPAVEAIVRRMLQKVPKDRFQSAGEIASALAGLFGDSPKSGSSFNEKIGDLSGKCSGKESGASDRNAGDVPVPPPLRTIRQPPAVPKRAESVTAAPPVMTGNPSPPPIPMTGGTPGSMRRPEEVDAHSMTQEFARTVALPAPSPPRPKTPQTRVPPPIRNKDDAPGNRTHWAISTPPSANSHSGSIPTVAGSQTRRVPVALWSATGIILAFTLFGMLWLAVHYVRRESGKPGKGRPVHRKLTALDAHRPTSGVEWTIGSKVEEQISNVLESLDSTHVENVSQVRWGLMSESSERNFETSHRGPPDPFDGGRLIA